MDVKAIQEVIQVAKWLDDKGLVNAFEGNVSIMRDGYLYITPSGKSKATLTEDMIAVFDSEGNQVSGRFNASSELKMHRAVYGMRENIGGIVDLLISDLNRRLKDQELSLELTPAAKDYIIEGGYDPIYGARPLKRYLQKYVETLTARLILSGNVRTEDRIIIDVENGELAAHAEQVIDV